MRLRSSKYLQIPRKLEIFVSITDNIALNSPKVVRLISVAILQSTVSFFNTKISLKVYLIVLGIVLKCNTNAYTILLHYRNIKKQMMCLRFFFKFVLNVRVSTGMCVAMFQGMGNCCMWKI